MEAVYTFKSMLRVYKSRHVPVDCDVREKLFRAGSSWYGILEWHWKTLLRRNYVNRHSLLDLVFTPGSAYNITIGFLIFTMRYVNITGFDHVTKAVRWSKLHFTQHCAKQLLTIYCYQKIRSNSLQTEIAYEYDENELETTMVTVTVTVWAISEIAERSVKPRWFFQS
jgi:hypothetical protein